MLKLLLYLLIAYIFYVIVKFWIGVFKSIFNLQKFKNQFKKAQQNGQNTTSGYKSRQDGDVTINYRTEKAKKENKSRTDEIGEYIDYEEIK